MKKLIVPILLALGVSMAAPPRANAIILGLVVGDGILLITGFVFLVSSDTAPNQQTREAFASIGLFLDKESVPTELTSSKAGQDLAEMVKLGIYTADEARTIFAEVSRVDREETGRRIFVQTRD